MSVKKTLEVLKDHFQEIVEQETADAKVWWKEFVELHPADITQFLADLSKDDLQLIYPKLPQSLRIEVFELSSDSIRSFILSFVDKKDKSLLLNATPADELTDLFESFSNEELKEYMTLLNYKERQTVLSLMEFDPESAAGIMDTDVLTFRDDFTVEKAIHILQRIKPKQEFYQQIYVLNQKNQLAGYINLQDLVLKSPKERLSTFMHTVELVADAKEDQEKVAKTMIHYGQMNVPVVGEGGIFLGIIPSETLVEIIEQEASEDVLHMSAMSALPKGYFETSFIRLLYERSYILIILLLAQSFSTIILRHYEAMLAGFLLTFITMLVSTGGNSSSQTSALVIQGMATGEIKRSNIGRFLRREIMMALMMSLFLGAFSFLRVYWTSKGSAIIIGSLEVPLWLGSLAVSISLAAIVFVSVILGSCVPILLKRLRMDPAFAAGPFLATLMDILGLLLYCYISSLILS